MPNLLTQKWLLAGQTRSETSAKVSGQMGFGDNLGEPRFARLAERLQAKRLIVRRGFWIDATLIKAQPHPPRRGEASPDPKADWTRRGKILPFAKILAPA